MVTEFRIGLMILLIYLSKFLVVFEITENKNFFSLCNYNL